MSVERRLAGATARVPANAGPLNSAGLVQRALDLMRDVSPAYLQRFVAHADALMWLERATGAHALPPVGHAAAVPERANPRAPARKAAARGTRKPGRP
jgi:hypothetical protein